MIHFTEKGSKNPAVEPHSKRQNTKYTRQNSKIIYIYDTIQYSTEILKFMRGFRSMEWNYELWNRYPIRITGNGIRDHIHENMYNVSELNICTW
jgi:hypothetical protein